MTSSPAVPDDDEPKRGRRVLLALLAALALLAQTFVAFTTFVMGLGWAGPTYVIALVQAGAAFVLIVWLAGRRPAVLLVPVLSAALTAGLFGVGYAFERATACSGAERAAVQELVPPPGTTVEFEGEYVEGCVARTRMTLTNQDIVEHYEAEFARLGWRETPGQLDAVFGTAAVKDGVRLTVEIDGSEDDGGQMLEAVVGGPGAPSPCVVNRVGNDESMSREPTSQVEPGQWMMFVSADDLPASVVVRDGTGSVIFEQQAHARPDDNDELIESQDAMGGVMTLSLEEGAHEVECRPRDGAATVVPLLVAWSSSGDAERARSVVLRVQR